MSRCTRCTVLEHTGTRMLKFPRNIFLGKRRLVLARVCSCFRETLLLSVPWFIFILTLSVVVPPSSPVILHASPESHHPDPLWVCMFRLSGFWASPPGPFPISPATRLSSQAVPWVSPASELPPPAVPPVSAAQAVSSVSFPSGFTNLCPTSWQPSWAVPSAFPVFSACLTGSMVLSNVCLLH